MSEIRWYEVAMDLALFALLVLNVLLAAHTANKVAAVIVGGALAACCFMQGRTVEMRGETKFLRSLRR